MREEILRLERVVYEENGEDILNHVNFQVVRGEVVGIVCSDNRVRDALISVITENRPISQGRVYYNGRLVNAKSGGRKVGNSIFVLRQKRNLIESMTVAENVFVVKGSYQKIFVNIQKLECQFNVFVKGKGFNFDISGSDLVGSLSAYKKIVAELCKAMMMGKHLVIICGINNYLGSIELKEFFGVVQKFLLDGHSFIYICENYEEAAPFCNRIALMREGSIKKFIKEWQFDIQSEYKAEGKKEIRIPFEAPVLEIANVKYKHIKQLNLVVYPGEHVTLMDMNNSVIEDLVELLSMGERVGTYGGEVLWQGKEYKCALEKNEISFISEEPTKTMLFKEMSYMDNFCFRLEEKKGYKIINRFIRKSIKKEYEGVLGENMNEIDISGLDKISLYRLVYYSIHLCNPKLVVCIRPFADTDSVTRREVEHLLKEFCKKKIAVLELISNGTNLDICSRRIVYVKEGRTVKIPKETPKDQKFAAL